MPINWKKLPRGSIRARVGDHEIDVWAEPNIWRWTVMDAESRHYKDAGAELTEDAAIASAIAAERREYHK